MSASGQSLPKCDVRAMSALPPTATKERTSWHVSKVPIPDLRRLAESQSLTPGMVLRRDIRLRRPIVRGNFQTLRAALVINKVLATALACTAYLASNAVDAAEMKILCASGMREVVSELQPQLARIAGQQVSISFDEAGELRKRLQGGEIADIAILPRIVLDEVAADGNIVPATIIDISQSSIGIGVRKDAPKPDIGSAEQFKHV